jgi:hypothetical protein
VPAPPAFDTHANHVFGSTPRSVWRAAGSLWLLLTLTGCVALARPLARPVTIRFVGGLSTAILDQNDLAIVRDGAPAYLLAVDGLIEADPTDTEMLLTGARLYGAYVSAFVEEPERRRRLSQRALDYARRALCLENRYVCEAVSGPFHAFEASLASVDPSEVATLYGFGVAWAGWVEAHAEDWRAIAQIPRIEALMLRIVELDEALEGGGAHLYLGVLLTQRPASLGGRPEEARRHFERAVALSEGRNLMVKVLYARQYGRLMFDRPLHDRLLREVLQADPRAPELTLANTLAQEQAQRLLDEADDYF